MVIQRGQIYWVSLGEPVGSMPAGTRPVVIVQSDSFNQSGLRTTLCVALTKNVRLSQMPGNVSLPKDATGLPKDSVANVTSLTVIDKSLLGDLTGKVPLHLMHQIDQGLKRLLDIE